MSAKRVDLQPTYSPFNTQRAAWRTGVGIGIAIGGLGAGVGLLLAVAGPTLAFGAVVGLLGGIYILSNLTTALYGLAAVAILLPFGALPFRIGFTPTFLDAAFGAFLLVYALEWMTGRRSRPRATPVHGLVALYIAWLILAFMLGLRFALPGSQILRQFVETLLSIGMVFVLVDVVREPEQLRRLVRVVLLLILAQAVLTLILYLFPDELTESLLVRLSRIGYPDGGVIRYIEDNPALSERAIGTWVDPNALGGILAIFGSVLAPQLYARQPLLPRRWLTLAALGCIALGILLTFSRAAMLGFGIGLLAISFIKGYRRFWLWIAAALVVILILPQTRSYVERFADAFAGEDLATQMRLGEYSDAFNLISQYPLSGVGFTGTPEIDLYTNVASMYLIMANQIGLVGVGLFAVAILGVFAYAWRAWSRARGSTALEALHLGLHAGLLTALISATADLYYFRLDFHASITLFWLVIALSITSSRLVLAVPESTVAQGT